MVDLTFLINMVNNSVENLTDGIKDSTRVIEDDIRNMPDKDKIGTTITQQEYDAKKSQIYNKVQALEASTDAIEQIKEAATMLGEAFNIIKTASQILTITAKLSVAAVPGGIAVLAAQELKDLGKTMMGQASSGGAALTSKAKKLDKVSDGLVKTKNEFLDQLNNL